MKIVASDNFNRETVSEFLVCDNIKSRYYADLILWRLQDTETDSGEWVYKLVDDNYILYDASTIY